MIYELRVYHAMPGKLAALVDRFRKTTIRLWEKHGLRPVGFWTVDIGENTNDLYYMLQWDDLGHRDEDEREDDRDEEHDHGNTAFAGRLSLRHDRSQHHAG